MKRVPRGEVLSLLGEALLEPAFRQQFGCSARFAGEIGVKDKLSTFLLQREAVWRCMMYGVYGCMAVCAVCAVYAVYPDRRAGTMLAGQDTVVYSVYSTYSLYSHTAIHAIHHTALYILPQ